MRCSAEDRLLNAVAANSDVRLHNLKEHLVRYALRRRIGVADAEDLAHSTLVIFVERGWTETSWAVQRLKTEIKNWRDKRKVRGEDRVFAQADGLGVPLPLYLTQDPAPSPLSSCFVSQVFDMVDQLPGQQAEVFRLHLQGYSGREMADCLGVSISLVNQLLRRARNSLQSSLAAVAPKPSHHAKYVGVKKYHYRYIAICGTGGTYQHLGSFATAEEAAEAYDDAARKLGVPEEKLNFPIVEKRDAA